MEIKIVSFIRGVVLGELIPTIETNTKLVYKCRLRLI